MPPRSDLETPLYDAIGHGYAHHRRADPRIAARIREALCDAKTVVNVGAGAGAYEPEDTHVTAIEPSPVMAQQRAAGAPPAILASAERLPLVDRSVDAAMALLTIHHWTDPALGVREMRRVARHRVVLLTVDPVVEADMWLFADYVPEVAERDARRFPSISQLRTWLGASTTVLPIEIPADCSDGFLLSYWNRPEALLDARARAATSGFATLDDEVESAAVERLADDLRSGAWERAYGHLLARDSFDAGLRLVVADVTEGGDRR